MNTQKRVVAMRRDRGADMVDEAALTEIVDEAALFKRSFSISIACSTISNNYYYDSVNTSEPNVQMNSRAFNVLISQG
jgi:hypothetical protein